VATELGTLAKPSSIEEAIKEADIIVLAVWFSAIQELFQQYESLFQGKIVIDPSNPIAPNEKEVLIKSLEKMSLQVLSMLLFYLMAPNLPKLWEL
jgi:predicted dinucleotide-binding enzyme